MREQWSGSQLLAMTGVNHDTRCLTCLHPSLCLRAAPSRTCSPASSLCINSLTLGTQTAAIWPFAVFWGQLFQQRSPYQSSQSSCRRSWDWRAVYREGYWAERTAAGPRGRRQAVLTGMQSVVSNINRVTVSYSTEKCPSAHHTCAGHLIPIISTLGPALGQ